MMLRRDSGFTSVEGGWEQEGKLTVLSPKGCALLWRCKSSLNNGFTEAWVEAWEGSEDGYGQVLLPSDSRVGRGL